MGLIEQEIKELRDMQSKVLTGEMTVEQVSTQLAISSQIAKREQLVYNIMALQAKHGAKAMRSIVKSNLVGDGTAIEVLGSDVMVCMLRGGVCVDREECLDFSGLERSQQICQQCEHFSTTRAQLLP